MQKFLQSWGLVAPGAFIASLRKGDNLSDFLFASLHKTAPSLFFYEGLHQKERICSNWGANSFLLE